ncbi:MAG: response regulator [Rhodobacter sp.]|nr:response regulator [Rhodobacter sp.]MCA3493292.1 response regulator [Rhodobacter sp.]MCA3499958.1 response regulator [Rhodobacter sp.]MCA3501983.1 response regulator [Rhodobacter sp.]MCA3515390.1 response regulator [Rhodobacter sp.]
MGNHVLVIEDEPNIVEAIRFILMRDGWDVSTLSDGDLAEDTIRSCRPDVVILDVMLPGRSGLEILAALRADAATRSLPVLMLTAKGQGRDRAEAERIGASRFMSKPFSNTEILASVRALAGV